MGGGFSAASSWLLILGKYKKKKQKEHCIKHLPDNIRDTEECKTCQPWGRLAKEELYRFTNRLCRVTWHLGGMSLYKQYWFYHGFWVSGLTTDHLTAGGLTDLMTETFSQPCGLSVTQLRKHSSMRSLKDGVLGCVAVWSCVWVLSSPHGGSASPKSSSAGRRRERWRRGKTLLLCH